MKRSLQRMKGSYLAVANPKTEPSSQQWRPAPLRPAPLRSRQRRAQLCPPPRRTALRPPIPLRPAPFRPTPRHPAPAAQRCSARRCFARHSAARRRSARRRCTRRRATQRSSDRPRCRGAQPGTDCRASLGRARRPGLTARSS
jgi:hypothetical protein